eukprot:scaffold301_cov243-Pinguiococcus_pyrenoidosus.AAC.29
MSSSSGAHGQLPPAAPRGRERNLNWAPRPQTQKISVRSSCFARRRTGPARRLPGASRIAARAAFPPVGDSRPRVFGPPRGGANPQEQSSTEVARCCRSAARLPRLRASSALRGRSYLGRSGAVPEASRLRWRGAMIRMRCPWVEGVPQHVF